MEKARERLRKFIAKLLHIRPQKVHFDYIAGMLTIPVLISAILLNYGNIAGRQDSKTSSQPTGTEKVIVVPEKQTEVQVIQPTQVSSSSSTPQVCQKSIGPIEISSPEEGETVSSNPVCITIDYKDDSYCSVVWSYRINNGTWSEYNSNSPCLYDVPNGKVTFDLRVKSTVSSDTENLTRTFNYSGSKTTPTPTPTVTPAPTGV